MTYVSKPSNSFAEAFKARLNAIKINKTNLRMIAIGAAVSCTALLAFLAFTPQKAEQAPQQSTVETTKKPTGAAKFPGQNVEAKTVSGAAMKLYQSADNAIRDFQMDLAVHSKPARRTLQNNDNPIKAFFIKLFRLFTLPGIFLGGAFIFCLALLGLVKPDSEDLGHY